MSGISMDGGVDALANPPSPADVSAGASPTSPTTASPTTARPAGVATAGPATAGPAPGAAGHSPAGRGATVWLTGLPSAGKTTIATALADRLVAEGHRVQVLDGDELRTYLTADLGFSKDDRHENVRRVGYVAELLARHGVKVLVPVIAPYAASRAEVRARHQQTGSAYLEVHVATPVEVCADRDVKGLYARQRAGELAGLTGVDDPYEPPIAPDVRIHAHTQSVTESADALYAALVARRLA